MPLAVDVMTHAQALVAAAKLRNIVAEDICDAGRTEVLSGTRTVAAFGPAPCSTIDLVTGKLRLMK
jgi:PTH2 family peptidyl-tRNA hydrolase